MHMTFENRYTSEDVRKASGLASCWSLVTGSSDGIPKLNKLSMSNKTLSGAQSYSVLSVNILPSKFRISSSFLGNGANSNIRGLESSLDKTVLYQYLEDSFVWRNYVGSI